MRAVKVLGKLAVIIPREICAALGIREGTELDIWQLGPSAFGVAKRKEMKFNEEETELLRKLLAIKFETRSPQVVEKEFSKSEKETLIGLMKMGAVTLYFSEKYPRGVYNIVDSAYHSLIRASKEKGKKEEGLEKGYLIIESETEAARVSSALADKIKRGEIVGIRGFDKKFYVVTSSFLSKYRDKVRDALKEQKLSIADIAKRINLDQQATSAILAVMNSEGEIVERRKGIFALS